MKFLYCLIPIYLALPSYSLFIILPLYLYPSDKGAAWDNVTTTIEAYPGVQWQVIVNPNSGPGTTSYPSDPNIISGIAKLNSYSNVNTVGYVDTAYMKKSIPSVNAEVDVYASWAGYSGAKIAIGGIYFDDVSNEKNSSFYYQAVAAHARSSMKSSSSSSSSSSPHVVFNPGYRASTQLFSYADTIVEFEDSCANYMSEGIIDQIPAGFRGQSALQIYDTAEGTDVTSLITTMKQKSIQAVYFGLDHDYKVYSETLLQDMAEAV